MSPLPALLALSVAAVDGPSIAVVPLAVAGGDTTALNDTFYDATIRAGVAASWLREASLASQDDDHIVTQAALAGSAVSVQKVLAGDVLVRNGTATITVLWTAA